MALFVAIREELPTWLNWGLAVLCVAWLGVAVAEESAVAQDQGKIEASGKFVPAQPSATEKAPSTPDDWRTQSKGLIEKTGESTFRIGKIQCNRETSAISFPAKVNARDGLIEYALVTTKGKVHEALLATEVSPLHLHMAALLLGWTPQETVGTKPVAVTIAIEWATNGPAKNVPLEDLVSLAKESPQGKTDTTLARGPWLYQGSVIEAGGFAAERDGSIISLISDPAALAGNPRPGHEDDTLHVVNTTALPPAAAPVTITIRPIPKDP